MTRDRSSGSLAAGSSIGRRAEGADDSLPSTFERACCLLGVAGLLTPTAVLAVMAYRSYSSLWYSVYVVVLVGAAHGLVWLVLAAVTRRRLGHAFPAMFALAAWSALIGVYAVVIRSTTPTCTSPPTPSSPR